MVGHREGVEGAEVFDAPAGRGQQGQVTCQRGGVAGDVGEALGVLVKEGLLIRYPGLGYYVVGRPGDPRPANPQSAAGKPDEP